MGAVNPVRRTKKAREIAEQFGSSVRTVQRLVAEPRADYEARAVEKRRRAQQMRADGASYREIADALDVKVGSIAALLRTPVPEMSQ